MAEICPVCEKKIGFLDVHRPQVGIEIHASCASTFSENPEEYGGKAIEKTEAQINLEKEASEQRTQEIKEHQEQQHKIEDKSVYVKDGSIHVKSFDMPFGDMVGFMVKWALASIPAFIILAIIGAIFFAIFTAIFVSTR